MPTKPALVRPPRLTVRTLTCTCTCREKWTFLGTTELDLSGYALSKKSPRNGTKTENPWPRANQVWSGYHIALDGASTCATHLSIQLTFFSDSNSIKFSQKNLKSQVISVNIMPFHVFLVKATDPLIPDAAGPALLVTSIGAGPEVRQC